MARYNWKVLFSGYAPAYAYEIGRLDTRLPFADLKRLSQQVSTWKRLGLRGSGKSTCLRITTRRQGYHTLVTTLVGEVRDQAERIEILNTTAEVVGIDRVDRTLMLLGPAGNVVEIEVSHAARNFDQIEVGDQVKIEYYESVALYLGKHGQKPDASAGLVAARSAKEDKPGGIVVEAVDVSAVVQAIDRTKRTVALKGPDGKSVTTKVDPLVKAFDTLQVGDSVHARYTEAIAISVATP
jgi:hypothetical protein